MLPTLRNTSLDIIRAEVERALVEGGLRFIENGAWETYGDAHGDRTERNEWLHDTWPCTENEYNYRVRLDGAVECVDINGIEWR